MNKITGLIRRLPRWVEVVLVLVFCFGHSVVISVLQFTGTGPARLVEFADAPVIELVVFEVVIGGVCIGLLCLRYFKIWEAVNFKPTIKGVAGAVGLFLATYVLYTIFYNLIYLAFGFKVTGTPLSITVSLPVIVLLSFVNPIFEEVFVVGYLFERLRNINPALIIAISVLIRVSYHLYQGWIGIISVTPMAILFAVTYWKTRNLFPLVLSHTMLDFTGLVAASSQ